MNKDEKDAIILKAQEWFRDSVIQNHIKNTLKLTHPSKFNINRFTAVYLANYLTGNSDPRSIAKILIYPRVLSTSISTSFGSHIQKFTNDVLNSFGSTTSGIDIEFVDQVDGDKKYCQLKAGPNTINKDDVKTIHDHFDAIKRLSVTNNLKLHSEQLVIGVIYGEKYELSAHYNNLDNKFHYPVLIGKDFWQRLTGDENFYLDLIKCINTVALEADFSEQLDKVVDELATDPLIIELSNLS